MKKQVLYLLFAIFVITNFIFESSLVKMLVNDSIEKQQLLSYNTRMARRLMWPNAPANVDLTATAEAENDLGTPSSIIAAAWFTENGPDLIETGALRKTYKWAMTKPIKKWSAYEGGRALNRLVWQWMLTTPEGKKVEMQFLSYAAAPYTAMDGHEQKIWASSMFMLEENYRSQIHTDHEREPGIINKPSYGRLEKLNDKILLNRDRKVSHAGKGKKHP